MHEHDRGAHVAGKAHLVGHHEQRHALGGELADHAQHLAHELGVEGRGDLVAEQDLGRHRQGAGDGHPLLLPARELVGVGVELLGQAHLLQHRARGGLDLVLARALHHRRRIRAALHRLDLSWKKAKKLLGRADPVRRQAFVEQLQSVLAAAQRDQHLLVYLDEAHIHQDADLGYGWAARGQRLWVASSSPGLSAKVSFYGLYLYNEAQVRLWPYPRANGAHTIDVLRRLRDEHPDRALVVLWDGASYHRAGAVRDAAATLNIELMPLPGYSPDLMPVEALWRWLREDVTYHHCHPSRDDLTRRIAAFQARVNQQPFVLADRLWVKDQLDPEEEKLRFSN